MEREPVEPAVVAVELMRADDQHRRRSFSMAAIALGCSLLGACAVLLAARLAPQWFAPAPAESTRVLVPLGKEAKANSLYTVPSEPASVPNPAKPVKTQTRPSDPAKPMRTPSAEPAGAVPLNPFSGAIVSRVPEGWDPAGKPSEPPGPATSAKGPSAAPAQKSNQAILVTGHSGSSDPEGEANAIASSLRGAGASVRIAPHYNLAGSVVGVQIVATVPSSAVASAISGLRSNGVGGVDQWSGSAEARADRAVGMIASRLSELRAQETKLREKFEDDATEVAVVREEIQKLNQGIGMARAARSPGIAIVLIGIGAL